MKRIATFVGIASIVAAPLAGAIAQQPTPPPSGSPNAVLVGSDALVGSTVRSSDGRDVGKVDRLMIDPSEGRIASIVISTGGTLGMGAHMMSLPWNSVKVGQDRGKVIVTANQMLETAPSTDRARPAPQGQAAPNDQSKARQ
jgi:sporulation protein YlmC with PRC-barrel domain